MTTPSTLGTAIGDLTQRPGGDLAVGGLTLPRLFDGLRTQLDLTLVRRQELASGAIALRDHPDHAPG